jgi:hypothetical protein
MLPVPWHFLWEETVKVIDDPKLTQTSGSLIETINDAHSRKTGKVSAVERTPSGYIIIIADS